MKPNTVGRAAAVRTSPRRAALSAPRGGFLPGTNILSQDGAVPVEYLCPGDRIVTRDAGFARLNDLRWRAAHARMVAFAPGSLGHIDGGAPLILPADQPVLVRDWRAQALFGRSQAVARAIELVDGGFICALPSRSTILLELVFDRPHIVYAGGVEAAALPPGQTIADSAAA